MGIQFVLHEDGFDCGDIEQDRNRPPRLQRSRRKSFNRVRKARGRRRGNNTTAAKRGIHQRRNKRMGW